MNLLGDPLLRLRRPAKIDLQCEGETAAGQTLQVRGNSNTAGQLTIELVYRRDRFRTRPKRRRDFDASDEKLSDYQKTYLQAHDQVCVSKQITVAAGSFETSIDIPDDAKGECEIRAMVIGDPEQSQRFSLGSHSIKVTKLVRTRATRTASELPAVQR